MAQAVSEITDLLLAWQDGDDQAHHRLIEAVHCNLVRLAARHFSTERSDHTLQPTALVNEVYINLVNQDRLVWRNRAQFFAIASRIMRRVLVDHARRHNADKRRAQSEAVTLELANDLPLAAGALSHYEVLDLERALDKLERKDQRQARIIELRFFGGLSIEECAIALKISPSTVKDDWRFAKAWLNHYLSEDGQYEK